MTIINICITSYYSLILVTSFSYYFLNIFIFCSYVHGFFGDIVIDTKYIVSRKL